MHNTRKLMRKSIHRATVAAIAVLMGISVVPLAQTRAAEPAVPATKTKISFARDIRPILANHCWSCHGQDEGSREADLRLDLRASAVGPRDGGKPAIVPDKPESSPLVARIESDDAERQMPPPSAKKPLNAQQKQLLRDWVAQGADYSQHWAFIAPKRPELPTPKLQDRARNPIDLFILQRLELEGLPPSTEAPREVLLRRVTLDLTGLPPTLAERKQFLADESPQAYENLVDRLLASTHYGERMAMHWLDVARYADTNGYNNDEERTMWPWRDWVIDAFRRNLPYDKFLTEQLAGDLLPNATQAQKIATGFNRNHVLTTEGGIIDEEYRIEYVADRVHTTATVFTGLSLQCARCHDHKFDPVSQREYYQFFAFFNNLQDGRVNYNGNVAAAPFIKVPTAEQQSVLDQLASRTTELQQLIKNRESSVAARVVDWEQALTAEDRQKLAQWGPLFRLSFDETAGETASDTFDANRKGTVRGKANWTAGKVNGALEFDGQTFVELGQLGVFDGGDKFSFAAWVYPTSAEPITVLSKMDDAAANRGYDVIVEGGKVACHLIDHWPDNGLKVISRQPLSLNEWHHVAVTYDASRKAAGVKVYADGKLQPVDVSTDKLTGTLLTDKPLHIGRRQQSAAFKGRIDDVHFYAAELTADDVTRLTAGQLVSRLVDLLAIPAAKRNDSQRAEINRYYLDRVDTDYRKLKNELADLPKQKEVLDKTIAAVMVMEEMPQPRQTHLLRRGQYDQPGDPVTAGVPAAFLPLPAGAPANRLGLANWLLHPEHPLTARVAVNRWWEMYFGAGLVETSEDFGITGALPTHPELLDWLATELIRSGWDVKALQKLIVMSATYRQSSHISPVHRERDPKNQLLTRGPRFRLPAEVVRDNALAISGLLVDKVGGPSVRPYQPEGLWEEVSVERRVKYVPDPGDGLYRRTMYTFWKRTCPPPALSTFDAPTRETCTIRRARTNTPLQALVLLNDPTYIEAARRMAERLYETEELNASSRLSLAFELAISRKPHADEEQVLIALYELALQRFTGDTASATKLISIGKSPRNPKLNEAELAAWTVVCTTILNLDETISKD